MTKDDLLTVYIRSRQDPGSENVMDLVKKYISFLIDQHHRDNPGQRCVALFDMSPPGETSLVRTVRHQTQNICITFVQCRTNVEDVGPMLYKCYTNVLYLLRRHRFQTV